jgi:methyl-accepting chemotaxis protein
MRIIPGADERAQEAKGFAMLKLRLPTALSRMNIRIGTKLAITVGIGVVLVAGMIVNQQLSNTSVARQTELARDEHFVIAALLSASVALQRMQVGTREIRLAISESEADQALAGLRESMGKAVSYLQAAVQLCGNAENCGQLENLVKLAKDYAAAAAEMTALKKDYGEIAKPLEQINKIGTQINVLIEKVTSDAKELASQYMIAATARMTKAAQISIGFGLFVVVILMGAAIFGVLSIGKPIRHIAGVLLQLADGSRELDIPYTGRGDEVGDAARAARTFRDNLVRLEKLEAEQKQALRLILKPCSPRSSPRRPSFPARRPAQSTYSMK